MNTQLNLLTAENSLLIVIDQQPKLSAVMPILGVTDKNITKRLTGTRQIFSKTSFSCFAADGFYMALRRSGRRQIVLVGQEAHLSVLQTALELFHIGYDVYVVEDAVCSRKTRHNLNAMQRLQRHEISVINYESVLFEWVRDSSHPDFRRISALLRQ
jgi:isochorismate hydrolase